MESTSVIQQKGLPKDAMVHKGDSLVSQKCLDKSRVIPQPPLLREVEAPNSKKIPKSITVVG